MARPARSTRPRPRRSSTEAGGFTGKLTIAYNADSAHKEWVEAVCNSIKQSLAIECAGAPSVDFATFLQLRTRQEDQRHVPLRLGMDYPSIENFLAPLYGTGAGSNDAGYSNPAFDAKLKEAAGATDPAASNELYQEAERIARRRPARDPALGLHGARSVGLTRSPRREVDAFGDPNFAGISLK